jgi:NTE family protein
MSRALVLGGGGPVGIGWEAGLMVGLEEAGVAVGAADLILGTSAGSVVGAQLARAEQLGEVVELVSAPLPLPGGGTGGDQAIAQFMEAALAAATSGDDPVQGRRQLGQLARSAPTVDEEEFVALFATVVGGAPWPDGYACTAVDIETGEFKVWDKAAGVPLERAIASSCAVPAVLPPITIDGRRYMDGGMKSAMNVDVAAGHDVVVAVSCFALELPEGMSDPMFEALKADTERELAAVRSAGALEVVAPGAEMLDISGWGMFLMDPSRAKPAFEAGKRQAAAEADRLRAAWA